MGLIFTTVGWTGAEIEFVHSTGTDTFLPPNSGLNGDALNPLDVALALEEWFVDYARRPWDSGDIATASLVVEDDGKRHRFAYTLTGGDTALTITPNAAWIACFGDTSESPVGTARGTLAKDVASYGWLQHDKGRGAATREGSWRMGHQAFAFRSPTIDDRLTALEVEVLSECQAYAAQPRQMYILDRATWRLVSVGAIDVADVEDDPTQFDVTIEACASPALLVTAFYGRLEYAG